MVTNVKLHLQDDKCFSLDINYWKFTHLMVNIHLFCNNQIKYADSQSGNSYMIRVVSWIRVLSACSVQEGLIIIKHEVAHQLSLIGRHKEGSMPTNSENEGVLPSFPMVPAPLSYVPATSNLDTVKVPMVVLRCINKDEAASVVDDQKDFENLYEMHMSMLVLPS